MPDFANLMPYTEERLVATSTTVQYERGVREATA